MAKTIMLEALAPEVQRALEEILLSKEPVILARDGQPLGQFEAYSLEEPTREEMTPVEIAGVQADIQQSDADFAAGRYLTLDEMKTKYAARLQGSKS